MTAFHYDVLSSLGLNLAATHMNTSTLLLIIVLLHPLPVSSLASTHHIHASFGTVLSVLLHPHLTRIVIAGLLFALMELEWEQVFTYYWSTSAS